MAYQLKIMALVDNNTKDHGFQLRKHMYLGEFIDSINIYCLSQIVNRLVGETNTVVYWSQLKLAYVGSQQPSLCISSQSHFSDLS